MSADLMIRIRANAAEAQEAFRQTSAGLQRIQRDTGGVSRAMSRARVDTGNLTAQFQDIGVMLAAGQNPLQLALQQGTQISQVLGPMGAAGAVKALGGAFLALLNPVSLITIALIAGGAAAFQWATSTREGADTAKEAYDRLVSSVNDYKSAQEAMDPRKMADAYGAMTEHALQFLEIQRDIAQIEAQRAIATATVSAGEAFGRNIVQRTDAELQLLQLLERQVATREELGNAALLGGISAADERRLNAARNLLAEHEQFLIANSETRDEVRELANDFGISTEKAWDLARGIAAVGAAEGPEEQKAAAEALVILMDDATDGMKNADAATLELYQALTEVVLKGLEFEGLNLSDPIDAAARSTDFLVGRLEAAISRGEDFQGLVERLNEAVDRSANAEQYQAEFAARAGTPQGANDQALVSAVAAAAARTGYDPAIVLALMGVESGWNPGAIGGAGGNYQGLIQFGPWERENYGVSAQSSIEDQVNAAFRFLGDRGVRPGDAAERYYAAVLAGNADLVNAGDVNNGGRVRNVMEFVNGPDWANWQERAQGLLGAYGGTVDAANQSWREQSQAAETAARLLEQNEQAYRRLVGSMDPAIAAQQAFADGVVVLDAALAAGQITIDEHGAGMAMLNQRLQEAQQGMQGINDTAMRGADAIANLFGSFGQGADAAKRALAQLLQQMLAVSLQRQFRDLAGANGGNNIFGWMGQLLSLDGGGYTGNGARSAVAGVVHGGEYVFSADAVDRIGLRALESLHKGYANGGYVGDMPSAADAARNLIAPGGGILELRIGDGVQADWLQRSANQSVRISGSVAQAQSRTTRSTFMSQQERYG